MFGIERGKGGNIVVWLILGILALAFGFTFGLPSDQLSFGESGLVKVHGESVGNDDFVYQRQAIARVFAQQGGLPEGEQAQTLGVREEVLEAIIERLVLNEIGEDLGLMTETHDAELLTKAGFRIVLDEDQPYPWAGTEAFSYEEFKGWLREFGVSESRYLEIQRQELLARQVRDLIAASVTIPESELWAAYEQENNQLSLEYVLFNVGEYAEMVEPSEPEIDVWMVEHEAELQEQWERNQPQYLKLPAQVDLRLIEIAKPIAPPQLGTEGADAELVAAHQERLAAARAAAEQARTRIVEGGESFASVAREVSQNLETARSGGRFGWTMVTDGGSKLDPIVDTTAQNLETDAVSEVVEGETSFYVVMVAGRREGDVPEAVAKREIAANMVRSSRAKELAKAAADEALLAVSEGTALDELFKSEPALGEDGKPIEDYGMAESPAPESALTIKETGLFNHGQTIPGIGAHPKLTIAAWEADPDAPIIPQVFEVPGGYVIASVDERLVADKAGFAEARSTHYRILAKRRADSVLTGFTRHECYVAKAKVDIRINEASVNRLMSYDGELQTDENGVRLTPPYRVCARVGERGGMLHFQMMLQGRGMR